LAMRTGLGGRAPILFQGGSYSEYPKCK